MINPLASSVLVIDAGMGNIGSVVASIERLGVNVDRLTVPEEATDITLWSHAVLPGVGSFNSGMQALTSKGWDRWIVDSWCNQKKPFLGICLGMQLLANNGVEGSDSLDVVQGLGLIPGEVRLLPTEDSLTLPHVGWNSLMHNPSHPIFSNFPEEGDMYFVHSYRFHVRDSSSCLSVTHYGDQFPSVVGLDNCIGAQFHPEKSQRLGKLFLRNFLCL